MNKTTTFHDLVKQNLKEFKSSKPLEGHQFFGLKTVDRFVGSIAPTDLVVLAGRPGMGKQNFALTMCMNMSIKEGKRVHYYATHEQSTVVSKKILGMLLNMNVSNNQVSPKKKKLKQMKELLHQPIDSLTISDDLLDIDKMLGRIEALNKIDQPEMIIIGSMNFLRDGEEGFGNRDIEEERIVQQIKAFSKKMKIPVVLLVDINRNVEWRGGDKRPILSDIRGTGAIEQMADKILFVYRPSYYCFVEDENGDQTEGKAEIIVARNRNGKTGEVKLSYSEDTGRFDDLTLWKENGKF